MHENPGCLQRNRYKKQFIELSLKSLVYNRLTLTFPLPSILVFYNNAIRRVSHE